MTIVMGFDQHRAQITTEWLDSMTGEIGRARIAPAHRAGVRRFLTRFADQELEVALEATTGWRFVVEELRRVGAEVHLAEPAQTSALRGNKKRAKSDRADARHLRELLMIGRLPESWIPPAHLLDLRLKVRLRHTLVDRAWRPLALKRRRRCARPSVSLAGRDDAYRCARTAWFRPVARLAPTQGGGSNMHVPFSSRPGTVAAVCSRCRRSRRRDCGGRVRRGAADLANAVCQQLDLRLRHARSFAGRLQARRPQTPPP